MHTNPLVQAGTPPEQANKVLVLIHGRGGSPEDMLPLAPHLKADEVWALAPRATSNTWYPYSFMAPENQNQPWLDAALSSVDQAVSAALQAGFTYEHIYFVGFSQGACLMLEYTTRNARRYGGIIAFTGGLIGATLNKDHYQGDFAGTPIHISAGDNDPHVPLSRIEETAETIRALHGDVLTTIYPDKPHSISGEEIETANRHVLG